MSTPLATADRALYAERCRVVDLEEKLAIAEAASRPVFSRRMLEEKLAASEERARRLEEALLDIRDARVPTKAMRYDGRYTTWAAAHAAAAIAPPPEAEEKGGEQP